MTCSVKKAFLEISQNSQENTCVRVFFFKKEILVQVFSCESFKIFKNTFSYRTPAMAALHSIWHIKNIQKLL